jgi:glycosyltransferase involved in cell wall biosynthesis
MFSVVIPLYNKAPHIEATLESVLAQHIAPLEVIVVDDGSTDGGDRLVESFSNKGVRLIRQKNSGPSVARNTGVAASRSDYVAFLDADDTWLPMHLSALQEAIERVPHAGLASTLHQIYLGGRTMEPRSAYPLGFVGKVDDFFAAMSVGFSLINSSTACVKRTSFLEVGGFPIGVRRGEDLVAWMKIARLFDMTHSATITATYNRDAVNRSSAWRESEAPGSLLYLRDIITSGTLVASELRSANLFFQRVAFYTAAGMKVSGDLQGMHAIRKLAAEMKLSGLVIKVALLMLLPSSFLLVGRRFRHRVITHTVRVHRPQDLSQP